MKGRSFLLALVAVAMVLLTLALGFWWAMARQSPLRIMDRSLELPRAARFMPTDAALTLHWLVDPRQVPSYAQAVAPVRQRRLVNESTRQLRDGAFALAGLDFGTELAGWIGPEVSFAVLDAPAQQSGEQPKEGWVLALSSRDEDGAKRFLQRFWQTRSLAGTDLQISRYRGMGLISGRGALLGRDPQPIATALIDDDLLLLASGRGVLEQALDVSQLDSQHQLGNPVLASDLQSFGRGAAVLIANPGAMDRWLGVPSAITAREDLQVLVAALTPRGSDLALDAVVHFREPRIPVESQTTDSNALLNDAGGDAETVALLTNPAALLAADANEPLAQWIAPLLRKSIESAPTGAAAAVVELDEGPMLWQQGQQGWVLGTWPNRPDPEMVDGRLQELGLTGSTLDSEGQSVQVWTRLARQRRRGEESLQAELAVALERHTGVNWWAETLDGLRRRGESGDLIQRKLQLQELESSSQSVLAQQLALAAAPSRLYLGQWRPWELVQGVAGRSLLPAVQGLSIAAGADQNAASVQDERVSSLRLRARLQLG
ncbi:DUF3352 domain-containing protein [Synechococcus sp. UW179A]|uniref:DUF3352 domain-containing protein n=1 Tax=Synechococcus sp. UW179A TaxID=2575510 RepID=UPI000E0E7F08|nr:DUF3352 domain-containing protein [Synechococcus sp. UW179A]